MRVKKFWVTVLLSLFMVGSSGFVSAGTQQDTPPRGRAYGYYMKDGGKFLLVYVEEDGSRYIQLSQCHQNRRYIIHRSEDLINWSPMAELQIGSDGTAWTIDTIPTDRCFYTVTRTK